jgi:archaellum biogenesis ATPase FlaH
MDFVLIDNAAVLPAFNSMDSIREFFSELGNLVRDHQKMRTYIVVPKDLHPKMFETLRNFVDQIIEIPDEWVL